MSVTHIPTYAYIGYDNSFYPVLKVYTGDPYHTNCAAILIDDYRKYETKEQASKVAEEWYARIQANKLGNKGKG